MYNLPPEIVNMALSENNPTAKKFIVLKEMEYSGKLMFG